MTYLVGYGPHDSDRGAIELACQLARSVPQTIRAVTVVPQGWGTPAAAGTDREFEAWAADEGEAAAAMARSELAVHQDVEGSAIWVSGRSVAQTLLEQAEREAAGVLVVGSGQEAEPGRVRVTSKTDRLVHSSPIPVAIAPRGYRTDKRVERVTVAFRDDDASWSLLSRVAGLCRESGARLRVVTFVITPPRRPVTARASHTETQVIDLWKVQAGRAQGDANEYLRSQGFDPDRLAFFLAEGTDWGQAIRRLDWEDGDILAVGSSATHPIARVFLGSSAAKIIRVAPVPVVAVPGIAT